MSMYEMKVYSIQAEGDFRIVEAESYGEAVAIWQERMRELFGEDWDDAEPESVNLLSEDPVIRKS